MKKKLKEKKDEMKRKKEKWKKGLIKKKNCWYKLWNSIKSADIFNRER
jgi:hypothetical protein